MKISIISLCCLLSVLMFGCGYGNMVRSTSDKQIAESLRHREEEKNELQKYLGATKEQMKSEFGKPKKIMYNIEYIVNPGCPSGQCERKVAEEVWIYEDWGLLPFLSLRGPKGAWLYFIDGVVVKTRP